MQRFGLACLSAAAMGIVLHAAAAAAQTNPIVIENQQPGTSGWQIPWGRAGTDAGGQIKGYASATSVNKGENITFFVSTNPAQAYTMDIYRIGWYQGLGGRLMQHVNSLSGVQQPSCPTDATTGLIECQWTPTFTLTTQTSWTSGIYLALLTNAQNYQNYIIFVVRDDSRPAALLYQQPVTTYQAYNDYPYDGTTGKSLYAFNSYGATTIGGTKGAVKVSFDRPYMGDGTARPWGQFFLWEIGFIRWMEESGYDVSYSTDLDTHTDGSRLLNYHGFLSVGHDEYWSRPMYDAVTAARDAGVNLGFFGANAAYTQVRFEASSSGAPNRVIVCYRSASLDPVADPSLKTVNWRDQPLNRPEQTLIGVQVTSQVQWHQQYDGYASYVVTNSGNWVYEGTGFVDGDSVPGIVGYEADRWYGASPQPNAVSGTYTLLSNSPYTTNQNTADYSDSSIYQAPGGAWVFAAGTMGWNRALDNYTGWNVVDPRIQRMTANILDRFVGGIGDFTIAASPSSPSVTSGSSVSSSITISPVDGFSGPVNLSVSGLPGGATATFTPNPATASSNFSVTTSTGTPAGTYPISITGISGSLTHGTTLSLTVAPAGVTYDNRVSSGIQFGVTSVTTPSFIVGSGANRAAMIMVAMSGNGAAGITASLGGVSGTLIDGTDSGAAATIRTMIFQVINPPPGAQTATVSWSNAPLNVDVGVITVSGADQIAPCTGGTFAASNSTPAAATSVTVTSSPGDLTASVGFTGAGWASPFTNQTLNWGVDSAEAGGDIGPGTGTTTHTWTDSYYWQGHAVSGANFKAAVAP